MNDHEAGFLAFVGEPQRRRLRTLFELGGRRRGDIVSLLDHSIRLDRRYCQPIPRGLLSVHQVESRLVKLGAATCFVLGGSALDGGEFILKSALLTLIGLGDGAFVSCIPGRLGYYQYDPLAPLPPFPYMRPRPAGVKRLRRLRISATGTEAKTPARPALFLLSRRFARASRLA